MKAELPSQPQPELRHARAWWAAGWVMVALVILGSLMPSPIAVKLTVLDKVVHGITYALLMWWFAQLKPGRLPVIGVSLALLGILIEGLQGFQRGRVPDPADVAANLAGLLLGALCARMWCRDTLSRIEARLIKH